MSNCLIIYYQMEFSVKLNCHIPGTKNILFFCTIVHIISYNSLYQDSIERMEGD